MDKLSVITINLNNLEGLKKTMDSVFMQTYPNLEYIVIDGNSTDGSKEVIQTNENKIDYWISEKDKNIYDAMNKGILKSTGEYLLFLNSGDTLTSEDTISRVMAQTEEKDIVYCNIHYVFPDSIANSDFPDFLTFDYFIFHSLPHQASFIKRSVFDKTGLYDTDLKIASDWKVFLLAIFKFRSSYKLLDFIASDCDMNGLSCQPENRRIVEEERAITFEKEFPEFLTLINSYKELIYAGDSSLGYIFHKPHLLALSKKYIPASIRRLIKR